MRALIFALAAASLAGEASATGGLWCNAEDKSARIELSAGITRGMGGPMFSFAGTVEALDPAVPADLRKTSFELDHVPQYWLEGEDLRLLLYRELGPDSRHASVKLTIKTRYDGEEGYSGRYALDLFDAGESGTEGKTWTYEGAISCGGE